MTDIEPARSIARVLSKNAFVSLSGRSRGYRWSFVSVQTAPDIGRLAQYRPWERGGLDLRAVLYDLIIAVAGINDGHVDSLLHCRRCFVDLWGLEVEVDELRPVVEELVTSGKATKLGGGFALSAETLADLQARAQESQAVEDRAFREWELTVRRLMPGLPEEQMSLLCSDLHAWLHQIIARHGAEAAMMLYPEEERAHRFFDAVDAEGFSRLPEREGELESVRTTALPLFIRAPTPDQRRFLASLLNTSFYMTVLTIDPGAEQLVQAHLQGHRIYLDTNFLYAILGAAPSDEVYSSRRLIQLSRDLGFEFAVTPWTMEELRTSIARSRRDIEHEQTFIRPELAETMLRTAGDKGFNRLFWQTYREKQTQPKDVFDRLEHFDQDLAELGIEEVTEGCTQVDQQEERVKLYASLLNAERWPHQREPIVLEHDAKCRLLVERLRGEGNITVSNARFWFLTYDAKLPRFALKVPDNGDSSPDLPFCISPSVWVQITRALTPRTEDFDRTVVDLLTSPFVGYRSAVNPAVVHEVVGRMDHYEDASPEMAIAVLTDGAKVAAIGKAVSSNDEVAVEATVKKAYSSKAREMQEAVDASQQRLLEIEDALHRSIQETAEAKRTHGDQAADLDRRNQDDRDRWEAEKKMLEEKVDKIEADRGHSAARAEDADQRLRSVESRLKDEDQKRKHHRKIGAGVSLVSFGLVLGVTLPLFIFDGPWGVGASIFAGLALALVGARVLLGRERGNEFVLWTGLLAAIAAVLVAVVLGSN